MIRPRRQRLRHWIEVVGFVEHAKLATVFHRLQVCETEGMPMHENKLDLRISWHPVEHVTAMSLSPSEYFVTTRPDRLVLNLMPHQGARHGGLVNVLSWWHWHLRRSVPGADRLVEAHRPRAEHALHVCHGRSVPGPDRLVEFDRPRAEHGLHVCHRRSVPGADRLVEFRTA